MATFTQYAIAAAKQALQDADWAPQSSMEKERTVRRFKRRKRAQYQVTNLCFAIGCMYRLWDGKF